MKMDSICLERKHLAAYGALEHRVRAGRARYAARCGRSTPCLAGSRRNGSTGTLAGREDRTLPESGFRLSKFSETLEYCYVVPTISGHVIK